MADWQRSWARNVTFATIVTTRELLIAVRDGGGTTFTDGDMLLRIRHVPEGSSEELIKQYVEDIEATAKLSDPTVILDEGAIDNSWGEYTLTEEIVGGYPYALRISEAGAGAGGYAMVPSKDIIDLTTAASAAPSNFNGAIPFKIQDGDSNAFGHDTLLVRKSDEANKIWARLGRSHTESFTLTIRRYTIDVTIAGDAIAELTADAAKILRSADAAPSGLVDGDHYVIDGVEYENEVLHIAGSTRSVTRFNLTNRHVTIPVSNVDQRIVNPNYASTFAFFWPNDAAVPIGYLFDGRFYYNTSTGRYRKYDGTNWADYDPHASGEPWDKVYPYGAYVDLAYTAGDDDGNGLRISMTDKGAAQIGENGNDWTLRIATSSSQTALVSVSASTSDKRLTITVKARDGGANAPTITAIAQVLANPSTISVGFDYLGAISTTDKVDSNFQADGDLDFANGSAGTAGVDISLPFFDIEQTLAQLDNSWTAAGQLGVERGGRAIWATTAYTAGAASHSEKLGVPYRPPGINDVVDESGQSKRALTPADHGRMFVDSYRQQAALAIRNTTAAVRATGTDEAFSNSAFEGIRETDPAVTAANKLYYRPSNDAWRISYYHQQLRTYLWRSMPLEESLLALDSEVGVKPILS